MKLEKQGFRSRLGGFFEDLLALRVRDSERVYYAGDPLNAFEGDASNRRPLRVAAILSILLHVVLLLITFPSFGARVFDLEKELVVLKRLAQPAAQMGGSPRPEATPVRPEVIPEPRPVYVPIPDPTPLEPKPIRRREVEETAPILDRLVTDLNIGPIDAPPGPPSTAGDGRSRAAGTGPGPVEGPGSGTGGDGVYTLGGDVTNPQILVQTTPKYTDDAIKAKVQGVVWLQAVIRRDGSVSDFKVLRGLGYGLEEQAIREIATNWKFRPGTLNGRPVDVLATIEVQFTLR